MWQLIFRGSIIVAAIHALGCNGNSQDRIPDPGVQASNLSGIADVAGYAHALPASRFALGPVMSEADENGYHKWIGTDGVFAIDNLNSASAGVPNGNSSIFAKKRFSLSGNAHGALVRDYFVANGLPPDQIGLVQNLSQVEGGGPVESAASAEQKLKAYYTVLTRQVAGVPAPDSHAWAAVTESGEVIAEAVHWPPIPKESVARALAFASNMASMQYRADYLSRLSPSAQTGMVVIRHGTRLDRGPAFATVVWEYNVPIIGPKGATSSVQVHFDESGQPVTLPRELAQGFVPMADRK